MSSIVILGGGPAAWSCAITLRNRNLDCIVVTTGMDQSGLAKAERVTNYPGFPEISGKDLLMRFREHALSMGVQERIGHARQVMPSSGQFMVLVGDDILSCDALILALGASRPKLLPGENEWLGQGVSWCGTCDGMFYRGKEIAVLSSWHGGVEEADFLSGLCSQVDYYSLRRHDGIVSPKPNQRIMPDTVRALDKKDGKMVLYTNTGEKTYDGVFIFRPNSAPDQLIPGLKTDNGFIAVDRRMQTSVPRCYACGDCTGKPLQIAKAVGEGCVAAISCAEDVTKA